MILRRKSSALPLYLQYIVNRIFKKGLNVMEIYKIHQLVQQNKLIISLFNRISY